MMIGARVRDVRMMVGVLMHVFACRYAPLAARTNLSRASYVLACCCRIECDSVR
jgi:hypothetical protein